MTTKTIHMCDVDGEEFEPKDGVFLAIEVVKHTVQGSPTTLVMGKADVCREHWVKIAPRVRGLIPRLIKPPPDKAEYLEGIIDVLMDHLRNDEDLDPRVLLEYTIAMMEKAP